jgi:hypothetical protein
MTRVTGGGGPPKVPKEVGETGAEPQPTDLGTREGLQKFREAAKSEKVPAQVVDSFERAAPELDKQLKALAGKALAGPIKFSSEQLAQIAAAFAGIIVQHPRADRKDRAHLFARAILKHKRIGQLFESADERELESMFETIAAQLDGSPVFAQLVEEVTEGVRKLTLG